VVDKNRNPPQAKFGISAEMLLVGANTKDIFQVKGTGVLPTYDSRT